MRWTNILDQLERIKHMRLKKAKWKNIAPALWLGHYLTHAHSHITWAVVRQSWTAVFDFLRPHQHSLAA